MQDSLTRWFLFTLVASTFGCAVDQGEPVAERDQALIGDVPTLVAVDGVRYSPGSGFEIDFSTKKGLYNAATLGNADLNVTSTVTVEDKIIVVGGCPLADLKQTGLADPRPDPLIELSLGIPWDGTDEDGNAVIGKHELSYTLAIVNPGG